MAVENAPESADSVEEKQKQEEMYTNLVDAIKRHQLVALVGAGANRVRGADCPNWPGPPIAANKFYAPDGTELTDYLLKGIRDRIKDLSPIVESKDLAKASQALLEISDELTLRNELRD